MASPAWATFSTHPRCGQSSQRPEFIGSWRQKLPDPRLSESATRSRAIMGPSFDPVYNGSPLERAFPPRHTSSRETWPQNGHRFWVLGQGQGRLVQLGKDQGICHRAGVARTYPCMPGALLRRQPASTRLLKKTTGSIVTHRSKIRMSITSPQANADRSKRPPRAASLELRVRVERQRRPRKPPGAALRHRL